MHWLFGKREKKRRRGQPLSSDEITEKCRDVFGDNLVSIVAYGPRVRAENVSGVESASLIIVLRKLDLEAIAKANAVLPDVPGEHELCPLIAEEGELFDVASSFPIEFLAAKSEYRILYGKDVLKDLIVSAEHLPLKAKLEIMRLYVRGRRELISSINHPETLAKLMARDFSRCVNALRVLLVAKRKHAPAEDAQIVERAAEDFSVDEGVLDRASRIGQESPPQEPAEMPRLFFEYLRELYFAYKAAEELSLKMEKEEKAPEADERDFIE
jgi:hypothetical protein